MAVRKFTNIYVPKYLCTSVNINGRFTYTLFLVCFILYIMCHYYIKKKLRTD